MEHNNSKCVVRSFCGDKPADNHTYHLHFATCNGTVYQRTRRYAMSGCNFQHIAMKSCPGGCSDPYFSCSADSDCPTGRRCDSNGRCDIPILSNLDMCSMKKVCHNGGTCMPLYLDYKCICPPGFKGKSCRFVDKSFNATGKETLPPTAEPTSLPPTSSPTATPTFVGQVLNASNGGVTFPPTAATNNSGEAHHSGSRQNSAAIHVCVVLLILLFAALN